MPRSPDQRREDPRACRAARELSGTDATGNLPCVALAAVSAQVLEELVAVATTDADADEVTPRLTDTPGWTPERVVWLRAFHTSRRSGLTGQAGEQTWAVRVDGAVVGSVRLKALDSTRRLETGVWLSRAARGRGVGGAVLEAIIERARVSSGEELLAVTTPGNRAAIGLLHRAGFELDLEGLDSVRARLELTPEP